jgi:molecular chaperone HtpG
MVADKVEIITKSFKDEPAAHWVCDGSPEYSLKKADKKRKRNRNYSSHFKRF